MINEASGHDAGDNLLDWSARRCARRAWASTPPHGSAATSSGVLLYRAKLEQALAKLPRSSNEAISEFRFAWRIRRSARTRQLGVVPITDEFDSATALLTAAESTSRKAKHDRRRASLRRRARAAKASSAPSTGWPHRQKNLARTALLPGDRAVARSKSMPASHEVAIPHDRRSGRAARPTRRGHDGRAVRLDGSDQRSLHHQADAARVGKRREVLLDTDGHWSMNLSASYRSAPIRSSTTCRAARRKRRPTEQDCFEMTETVAVQNLAEKAG